MVDSRITPQRLELECASMRHSNASLIQCPSGQLCWCDVIQSNRGNRYHVLIGYSPAFPFERPFAMITAPEIYEGAPHRYLDGTLCLFPSQSDPTMATTAGVVRGRTALWVLLFEHWLESGEWGGPEHGH